MSARASQKDRRLNIDYIITDQVVTGCRPASLARASAVLTCANRRASSDHLRCS